MIGDITDGSLCVSGLHELLQILCETLTPSWTTPHHKSPLDEINEIRRNAADSLWVLKVTRRCRICLKELSILLPFFGLSLPTSV